MIEGGISKLDLKRRNRMQVLKAVREKGPISRVDIAALLQITRAAVTIITNEMIDQHILEEVGEEPAEPNGSTRKGRRKILLDINETYKFVVGVYVDEKEISIGLTTMNSAALEKKTIAYRPGSLDIPTLVELVWETTQHMLSASCLKPSDVLNVGVGIMPSMFQAMRYKTGLEQQIRFPELQTQMEEKMGVPAYCNSAITEFAMAGITFGESHPQVENQVFLYCDSGQRYHAIPMLGGYTIPGLLENENYIEQLCVKLDGKKREGYPNGSVRAELSSEAMQEKVAPFFSQEQTPQLWKLLEGDLSRLTLGKLMTAVETDTVLQPVTDGLLLRFVILLYTLYSVYIAKYLCLFQFGFTPENLEQLRACAREFGGDAFADAILLSPIQERYRFLCGCTYAIQTGFYERGGLA